MSRTLLLSDRLTCNLCFCLICALALLSSEGAWGQQVDTLVGENIISSKKVELAVRKALADGKVLVVHTYTTSDLFHADIVSLGIGKFTEGENKVEKEGVVVTGQYGLPPELVPDLTNPLAQVCTTREEWMTKNRRYDAKIGAFVVVSKEKVEQLDGYRIECGQNNTLLYFPVTIPGLTANCWSYAEATWDDWLAMVEPEKRRTGICNEANKSYSGTCGGLKYVCASMFCKIPSEYPACVKRHNHSINSCIYNNTNCLDSYIATKSDCVKYMREPIHSKFKEPIKEPLAKTPRHPTQGPPTECKSFKNIKFTDCMMLNNVRIGDGFDGK